MPIMDGIEATQRLRKMMIEKEINYIPIIGLSAFSGESELRPCIEAGMQETLCKPISSAILKEKLTEYKLLQKNKSQFCVS